MTRGKKKTFTFLIGLICTIIITSISQYNQISSSKNYMVSPKTAYVIYNKDSLIAYLNDTLSEYSEDYGTKKNVSSIDINLDSPRWNVTNIEFNITDMYFQNETKTIEDHDDSLVEINSKMHRLGVQIQIEYPIIIYGVQIFGQNLTDPIADSTNIYIKIQGNNEANNAPDDSEIHGNPILLNMTKSSGKGWHTQLFTSSISLNKGIYYLVLDGDDIGLSPKKIYTWYKSVDDPNYPNLNISTYEPGGPWDAGVKGVPFLYKLIQRINKTYFPNQINMNASINEINYPIKDGKDIGTGNLSLTFKNFNPNSATLQIPIKNNVSDALIFNVSYYIKLNNSFLCNSKVKIREGTENEWTLNFNLDRFGFNYSVRFDYPKNWANLEIYRNDLKLTSIGNYSDDGNILEIFNDTISDNSVQWIITANSPNLDIELSVLDDTYNVGEELIFDVASPAKLGNYSFVLVDKANKIKYNTTVERDNTNLFSFNYIIPSEARSGEWTGFVYWNNATDAGVKIQLFQITGGTTIITTPGITGDDNNDDSGEDSEDMTAIIILAIVLIGGITSAVSISSYEGFKRLKKIRDKYRKRLLNQFKDLMNLNYIMITEKKSGLNIFEQYIAGQEIDATLISGFLNAIRAFGIELTKSNDQSQTISLEYKDSKVLMSEFKSFRIIVIMKERPSEQMIDSITDLSYNIENKYSDLLGQFKGNITQFTGISDLIEDHLHISFISPLKIVEQTDIKLSFGERVLINKAKELMKEYNLNYFHSTYLISEQNFKPSDVENILNLINKKIFQPTSLGSTGIKKLKES